MKIARKWKARLPAAASQFLLGITGLASITFICFQLGFGLARTAFAYVIVIVLVSLLGSFSASIVLSILAAASLNYFFAPPVFEFRIDASDDIVSIALFLTTSLVVTALMTRLRTSEARFRNFVDHATDAFILLDSQLTVLDVNRQACVSLGYSRAELIGRHPRDFDSGLDEASIQLLRERVLAGETVTFETRHRRKGGTSFPVEIRVSQFEQGGRRLLCLVRDITERKRAEDELRATEARFRTFVDHATDGFFLFGLDEHRTLLDVNRQACESLGYGREEMIGMHPRDFDAHLDAASIARLGERVTSGETVTFETLHRRKDGTVFPVEVRARQFEQDGRRFLCLVRDISERKRAEDELRASEERFRSFVDHATDGFFLLDEHQAVLDVNRQACESLGYSREEMIGMHPRDFDAHLDAASIARLGERVTSGETVTFETLHRRKDGTMFPVEIRARQFQHGAHRFRLSLARDITERKRGEEVLRESEAKLQEAQRIAHFGWWERDFATNRVSLSDEVCRIFGLEAADLPEWHGRWLSLIHPQDRPRVAEAAAAALAPGGPRYDVEYRVVRPDGAERIVHSQGDVRWDELGRPLRQFGVLQDITELRRAEDELRESEERFRTLVQCSFDAYWETDAEHRFIRQEAAEGVSYAPGATEIVRARHALLRKTRWELPYLEPDAEAWRKHRKTLDAHLPFRDFELARPTPDGNRFYVSVSGLPMFDKSGRFIGYRGVTRNITERKRAEAALRSSEAYLAEAQRLSHTGTLAFNASGAVYWSQESYLMWGLDPLQGLPSKEAVLERIYPDDRERVDAETEEAVRQQRGFTLEFRIVLPDGTVKHIEATGHPLFSTDGELVEMIATHVDVTERKRAEEEHERLRQLESDLAHVNRVSMVGELMASLAHEILHPIATARNNARAAIRFLDMNPPNMAEISEALACIVRDADRGKDIVDRIRDHIKKAPPRNDRFALNEAIQEVIEMVHDPIEKDRISVRTQLAAAVTSVCGDRVQLQQVILNLILNAVEAMRSVEERQRMLSIVTEQRTADVLVAVHDFGPGIDPEHLQRVFERFYTTKESGIGMGLSICRSIVAAHGGALWAESNRPRGAIFQFTLPTGLENS